MGYFEGDPHDRTKTEPNWLSLVGKVVVFSIEKGEYPVVYEQQVAARIDAVIATKDFVRLRLQKGLRLAGEAGVDLALKEIQYSREEKTLSMSAGKYDDVSLKGKLNRFYEESSKGGSK